MTELETMQRARIYLDKLARGIDPITDRELPEDTVLYSGHSDPTTVGMERSRYF